METWKGTEIKRKRPCRLPIEKTIHPTLLRAASFLAHRYSMRIKAQNNASSC